MTGRPSIRIKILLIIAGALAVYLAGNGRVSLWDRDEPRYAQTSRQMMQSGDWIVPKLLDEPREKKPVFVYWCQAAAMTVLGGNEFAARLPSSICVTLTLTALAISIWRVIGARRALWTVFVFGTSALTIAAAKMSITDGVLILFITTAQLSLYWLLSVRSSWPAVILCGVSTGFALLTKGPVVLGVMGMTCLAFFTIGWIDRKRTRRAKPTSQGWSSVISKWCVGIILALAVLSPWLGAMEHRRPGYTLRTLKSEVVDRAASAQEGHKGPPGYYLLLVWGTFFPWSLLLPAAMVHAWKRRHLPVIRFALAAVIGPWIMFELVVTKLPHYILPAYPFLAFLIADMLVRTAMTRKGDGARFGRKFVRIVAVWGVVVIAAGCLPWLSMKMFRPYINSTAIWAMFILTVLAIEYAREIYLFFRAQRPRDAAAVMGAGMMLLVVIFYVGYLPNAQFLRTSQRIADTLHFYGGKNAIMIDYKEDSLPWCEGGMIRAQRDNDFLLHHPPTDWPKFIVLTGEIWRRTPFDIQKQFDILDGKPIRGLAYSDSGRVVDVFVLRKKAQLSTFNAEPPTSNVER